MIAKRLQRGGRQYRYSRALAGWLLAGAACCAKAEPARDGQLDPSFGRGGWVSYATFGPNSVRLDNNRFIKMLVAPDAGFYIVGTVSGTFAAPLLLRPAIIRFRSNGQIDSTFGDSGVAIVPAHASLGAYGMVASGTALLPDGRIVIIGARRFNNTSNETCTMVLAMTPAGQLDASYGPGPGPGCVRVDETLPATTSLRPQGGVSIGRGGHAWIPVYAQSSAYGLYTGVARLDSAGLLDRSFGRSGMALTALPYSHPYLYSDRGIGILATADGGVSVLSGSYWWRTSWGITRFTSRGLYDPMLGDRGYAPILTGGDLSSPLPPNRPTAIQIDALGRTLVSEYRYDYSINPPGSGGTLVCDFCIGRIRHDGSPDATFNGQGAEPGSPGEAHHKWDDSDFQITQVVSILLRSRANITMAATILNISQNENGYMFALLGLRESGAIDTNFGSPTSPGRVSLRENGNSAISSMLRDAATDPWDRILLAGECMDATCTSDDCARLCLARLLDDQLFADSFE